MTLDHEGQEGISATLPTIGWQISQKCHAENNGPQYADSRSFDRLHHFNLPTEGYQIHKVPTSFEMSSCVSSTLSGARWLKGNDTSMENHALNPREEIQRWKDTIEERHTMASWSCADGKKRYCLIMHHLDKVMGTCHPV